MIAMIATIVIAMIAIIAIITIIAVLSHESVGSTHALTGTCADEQVPLARSITCVVMFRV